jgi:hypothetical protein
MFSGHQRSTLYGMIGFVCRLARGRHEIKKVFGPRGEKAEQIG